MVYVITACLSIIYFSSLLFISLFVPDGCILFYLPPSYIICSLQAMITHPLNVTQVRLVCDLQCFLIMISKFILKFNVINSCHIRTLRNSILGVSGGFDLITEHPLSATITTLLGDSSQQFASPLLFSNENHYDFFYYTHS